MAEQELLAGNFKVFVPDTDIRQLMGLVLSISGVKESMRLVFNGSKWEGRESIEFARLLYRIPYSDGVTRVHEYGRRRSIRKPAFVWPTSSGELIHKSYFRVSIVIPSIYEISIMGGEKTRLGTRVRQEFEAAFGSV